MLEQEYLNDMERLSLACQDRGIQINHANMQKIHAEVTLKHLVLNNRLTGASLALNKQMKNILHQFFSN